MQFNTLLHYATFTVSLVLATNLELVTNMNGVLLPAINPRSALQPIQSSSTQFSLSNALDAPNAFITQTQFAEALRNSVNVIKVSILNIGVYVAVHPLVTTVNVIAGVATWIGLSLPRFMVIL